MPRYLLRWTPTASGRRMVQITEAGRDVAYFFNMRHAQDWCEAQD